MYLHSTFSMIRKYRVLPHVDKRLCSHSRYGSEWQKWRCHSFCATMHHSRFQPKKCLAKGHSNTLNKIGDFHWQPTVYLTSSYHLSWWVMVLTNTYQLVTPSPEMNKVTWPGILMLSCLFTHKFWYEDFTHLQSLIWLNL